MVFGPKRDGQKSGDKYIIRSFIVCAVQKIFLGHLN
jgi:hypothetical protein